jgi:nucleoside-diphosphate-sugar epimerase
VSFQSALVTGGGGFTGSHLVRSLVRDGVRVRVLTRSARRSREKLPASVDLLEGRIEEPDAVERAVRGCEVVFHLATSFRTAKITDEEHRAIHVDGTRFLLEASRRHGVRRFVHVSTIGVTSSVEHPPGDETLPYSPDDVYQQTKAEGERLALACHRRHGDPVVVVRPTSIYGPGDDRLLKLFRLVAKGRFVMFGSGEVFFHMIHVDDLVRGLRLAATAPEEAVLGEVFILGGGEYTTLNDLVSRIARATGGSEPRLHLPVKPLLAVGSVVERLFRPLRIEPPIFRRRVNWFVKNRAFSIEKAARVLGFHPEIALDRGLRQTVRWYRSRGLLPAAVPVTPALQR